MMLSCEFSDKLRFYDHAFKQNSSRLFVATDTPVALGSEVEVEVRIGSDPEPVRVRGKVVANRTRHGAGDLANPGVWVQFSEEEGESLRHSLSIRDGEAVRTTARAHPRYERGLRVLIEKPVVKAARALNISQGGLCFATCLPMPVGQIIFMSLEFGPETIPVYGEIAWRHMEGGQTGVEFRFQNEVTRARIMEQVRRIGEEDGYRIFGKPSILVVDDEIATLKALERVLNVRGYGTLTATTGAEALSIAREERPALILLDVLLPGMNGLEVCRLLKRDAETSRIPVVLTSAMADAELQLVLEESGALVALPKPYRFETLEQLVGHVLDQNQALAGSPGTTAPMSETGTTISPAATMAMPTGAAMLTGGAASAGTAMLAGAGTTGAGDHPPLASVANRRQHARAPVFLRCYYESESLHADLCLRDASEAGAFLIAYWGDAVGRRAKLITLNQLEHPVELEVEVVRRSDWGIVSTTPPAQPPGMAVSFVGGAGLPAFRDWLRRYEGELSEKPVVMVVDDDRSHLEILAATLQHAGFAALTLDSPFGVASAIQLAKPALVILDFMMPELDGCRLCQNLKQDPATAKTAIWLHSSLSEARLQALGTQACADGYLQKGMRPSEIVQRIKQYLGQPGQRQ